MTGTHDLALVALSIAIAVFASFVALDIAGRLRAARGRARVWWLVAAASAMGGGIWAMHFVAMLSFSMGIPIGYDVPLTIASLLVAVAVTGVGLAIAAFGAVGSADRRLMAGGLLMGLGVAAMHYIGMSAIRMNAAIDYEPRLFALSVVIAVIAASAALWFAFNVQAYWHKLASAMLMGAAIAGMHFVGMAAAEYHELPSAPAGGVNFSPTLLAVAVAGATFLLLVLGLVTVVTDRHLSANSARAARRLELSARRHSALIRNSSDVIAILNERGQFAYCSDSAKRILGFASSWLIGRRLDEFLAPAELGAFYAFLARVQEARGVNMTSEIQLRHADRNWRAFEITCCNLRDEPGIDGIVANLRDMTERKRTLDELRAAKDAADYANRSKSEFLAAMSHELRTPLNAIIGFSEVMRSGMLGQEAGPRVLDYAKHIHESGAHLLTLINDILDLSKAESGKMTLIEDYIRPSDVVADSLRLASAQAKPDSISLDVAVPNDLPYLYGDKRRVRQVLANILTNAMKFTHAGGRIGVTATIERAGVEPRGASGSGDLLIMVQDSGIGMSADQIALALEPFRQVDSRLNRRYEGTGLGLPLSKHMMELHGGSLEIDSALDIGTKVALRFPVARLHATFALDEQAKTPETRARA